MRSKYSSNFGARESTSHTKTTGRIDSWQKTPFRFDGVVRDLKTGYVVRHSIPRHGMFPAAILPEDIQQRRVGLSLRVAAGRDVDGGGRNN